MTEPSQAIIEILTSSGGAVSAQAVYIRLMESGHTWEAVNGAIDALVAAGKVQRGKGRLSIVKA